MDDERYQKELFEFEEPKRPFKKLQGLLPKADFEGKVAFTFTLERLVFIAIGLVMAMILVFAIGVEAGKARRRSIPPAQAAQAMSKAPAVQAPAQGAVVPALAGPRVQAAPAPGAPQKGFFSTAQAAKAPAAPKTAEAARATSEPDRSRPYSILAGTFSKKETAQASAAYLAKEGFDSSVSFSQLYYRVYVGSYSEADGAVAQKELTKVRRIYKDAYIKLR